MNSFRSLIIIAVFALLTVCLADFGSQRISPIVNLREAADGFADLAASDPETLVLGSSHGRTFHVLGQQLKKKTNPGIPLVAVPLENGKWVPYAWVLENRIAPLIDERREDGSLVRSKLKRFILLTEWWDSCDHSDRVYWNIPSRAWSLYHYFYDLLDTGITTYNRNYLQYHLRRIMSISALIRDRYDPQIKGAVRRFVIGQSTRMTEAEYQAVILKWQRMVARGVACIGAPEQKAAFERILDFSISRGLETIVVLFPRMPSTLTDFGKQTTLISFRKMVEELAVPRNVKVIDLTWKTPLKDTDFMDDFDHVTASGNLKFAAWALENDLSFLLDTPPSLTSVSMKAQD